MTKTLGILIPTLPDRRVTFEGLRRHIESQIGDRLVQVIPNARGREIKIGRKRQMMLEACHHDYVVFIDDDDMVTHDYVEKVYDAIQQGPDVVGLRGFMTTNRDNPENWCISTKYDWKENVDGYRYVRYPNHLAPIKREHALAAGFTDMGHGEDYDYSMRLKKLDILKSEVFIDAELYHYIYTVKK